MAGVIEVKSGGVSGAALRLEGGSDDFLRGALTVGADVGPVRFDLAGSTRRGDGSFSNDFFDSDDLTTRLEWKGDAGGRIGLVARFNESLTGIPFASDGPSPNRTIGWKELEVALPLAWEGDSWTVEGQASLVDTASSFRDPDDAFGFTSSDIDTKAERLRVNVNHKLGDAAEEDRPWIGFGAETERLRVDDESVFGVTLDGAEQRTSSVFGELFWIWDRLTVNATVRLDDNSLFGSTTSPRLGFSFELSESLTVRGQYGEAFRAPSLGQLFFPFGGNPELQPEESETYELALDWRLGGWSASLAVFETRLTNLIDFDFANFVNVNVGRARTAGYEASLSYTHTLYSVSVNYTGLETEDRITGLPLFRRPEQSANLVASFDPPESDRGVSRIVPGLSLVVRYLGSRPDIDPGTFTRRANPSYLTTDLAASWRPFGRFAPYLRIQNLFDRSYEPALGFAAPGRSLVAGLKITLDPTSE